MPDVVSPTDQAPADPAKLEPSPAMPEPAAQPEPAAEPPAPPVRRFAMSAVARSRLRRIATVGGTLLFLFVGWEILTYFIAYTDDAYVTSDLVALAPEVTGPDLAFMGDRRPVPRANRLEGGNGSVDRRQAKGPVTTEA